LSCRELEAQIGGGSYLPGTASGAELGVKSGLELRRTSYPETETETETSSAEVG